MVARLDKSLVFTQKTETYAAFLDLEKANNEAWENAISWIIRNRGITHKMWEILYLLKENIKTYNSKIWLNRRNAIRWQ